MSIESEHDRLQILKTLGELVEIGGNSYYTIFERSYLGLDFDVQVESSTPQITLRTSDAKHIHRGDHVVRQGEAFTVETKENDGEGMTLVRLQEI